jgi:DNA repair photolyase
MQYRPLGCVRLLNENRNRAHSFRWTINPYRGCQFGCPFCYARYTHEYLDPPGADSFDSRIYVKFQAAQVLAETLKPGMLAGRPIALGTASDPYQPAEQRFRITRKLLEVLTRCPNLELSITTRSPLIERDLDLLRRISRRARLSVNLSLITLNPSLARILEPGSPTPRRRLRTIQTLVAAGIQTGVFVMPILPGITDSEADLSAVLRASEQAGSCYAVAAMANIFGASWRSFRPILERHFPHLLGAYAEAAAHSGDFPSEIGARASACLNRMRSRLGLGDGPSAAGPPRGGGSGELFDYVEGPRVAV